jgi:MFS family permease
MTKVAAAIISTNHHHKLETTEMCQSPPTRLLLQPQCSSCRSPIDKILSLSIIAILTNACYTTIAPILPLELTHHYNQQQQVQQDDTTNSTSSSSEEYYISLIFLFFSLGSILTPPLISRHFETGGTMKIMSIAMIGMALLFYCLGSVFRLHNSWMLHYDGTQDKTYSNNLLLMLLIGTQFCIGGLLSIVTTGYYSTATLIRASNPDRVISSLEAAVGTGYILGPLIGSWLYDELGYVRVYQVVAAVMVFLGVVTFKLISPLFAAKKMDNDEEHEEDDNDDDDIECNTSRADGGNESQPLLLPMDADIAITTSSATTTPLRPTITHLLKHPRILVSALCITWINVSWTFVEPILAKRLDTFFHLGRKEIGVIFSLSNFVYIPATYLLQFAFVGSNMRKRRFIVLVSTAMTPLAVLLIGSNSIHCLIFGMLLLGLFPSPVWVMLLPSMQDDALTIFPHTRHRRVANDLTAGIYNSFMVFGQVVGYLIGPMLNMTLGFGKTTMVVGGLILMQAILYYYFVLSIGSDARLKPVRKA